MSPSVHPLAPSDPLEAVWRALSDRTRRAMLDRLRERPQTTGELAAACPQSRFAVMKHLDVLVAAGLVFVRRDGRERWNHLNPIPLQHLYERWVRPHEGAWAAPLLRFRDSLAAPPDASTPELPAMDAPPTRATPTATAGMLTVAMEIPIQATPARVWDALTTAVGTWWPRDFLVAAEQMQFEARLGGQLFEDDGAGRGAIWYTVYAIVPGVSIDLVGQLSPAYGGPAQSLLRLELRDHGHLTMLALTDAVVGNVSATSSQSLTDGWRTVFDAGLRQYVETSASHG